MFIRRFTRNQLIHDISVLYDRFEQHGRLLRDVLQRSYDRDEKMKRLKDANTALRHRMHHLEINEQSLQEAILRVGEGIDLIATHVGMELKIEPPKEAELVLKKAKRK